MYYIIKKRKLGNLNIHNTNLVTVNTKTATNEIPKLLLRISVVQKCCYV